MGWGRGGVCELYGKCWQIHVGRDVVHGGTKEMVRYSVMRGGGWGGRGYGYIPDEEEEEERRRKRKSSRRKNKTTTTNATKKK